MIVEPKRNNPILINTDMQTVQINDEHFSLNVEQFVGGEHYGISVVQHQNNTFSIKEYATQFPIVKVSRSSEALNQIFVYEEGKSYPWQFTLDGTCIAPALFETTSSKDLEYVQLKRIGMHALDLAAINSEMKNFMGKESTHQK